MKALTVILFLLLGGVGGFFLGMYYEAHRELTVEDIRHFRERLSSRADNWATEIGERLKGIRDE